MQKKKQQQLSLVKSLTEVAKEVKEVVSVLGLLPSLTYNEVWCICFPPAVDYTYAAAGRKT